jgi:hypothetical protein
MKRILCSWILLIAIILPQHSAANPVCEISGVIERMNLRLEAGGSVLGNKLDGLVKGSAKIQGHPRFANRPGYTPEAAAIEDISLSVGNAEVVAPGFVGDQSVGKYVEIATSDRVVDSANVSYLDQGAGLGYIARDSGLNDVKLSELLDNVHTVCSPNTPIFRDMGVTAAHVLDSVKVLRSKNVDLPSSYWGDGALASNEAGNVSGSSAELLIMANASRAQKRISGVGIDTDNTKPEYKDTAIDYFEDENTMVQIGQSLDTVVNKWDKLTVEQRPAYAAKLAKARFLEPNRNYIFKYLDPNGALPTQSQIEKLNSMIPNPANWFTTANFVPVTSLP